MLTRLYIYLILFPLYIVICYVLYNTLLPEKDKRTFKECVMLTIAYTTPYIVCEPHLLRIAISLVLGLVTDLYFIPKIREESNTGVA